MSQSENSFDLRHPVVFGRFRSWLKLLSRERVGRAYVGRTLFILSTSLLTLPLRIYERLRYRNQVKSVKIASPPIFIVGHPRSGTTLLHNLMCQDENLGYVTTFQAVAPEIFLVGNKTLRPLLNRILPRSRAADQVSLALDGPQEEEIALFNLSPHAFLYHLFFPQNAYYYFERYVLFRNLPEKVVEEWQRLYLSVIKKATLHMGGRRLVLKTPMNVGRVNVLLALFPNAKFVHIVRNPYAVFLSTRHMYSRLLRASQLQDIAWPEVTDFILLFYREMMGKFLEDRALIPQGNLAQVRFEDLEADPLTELRRVYADLNLDGFAEAKPALEAFIRSQSGYRKGQYDLRDEEVELANRHWAFAFKEWDYDVATTYPRVRVKGV